jgi:hypothetical protein
LLANMLILSRWVMPSTQTVICDNTMRGSPSPVSRQHKDCHCTFTAIMSQRALFSFRPHLHYDANGKFAVA